MMKHTLNERCVERAWVLGRDHRVPKFLGLHERSNGWITQTFMCYSKKQSGWRHSKRIVAAWIRTRKPMLSSNLLLLSSGMVLRPLLPRLYYSIWSIILCFCYYHCVTVCIDHSNNNNNNEVVNTIYAVIDCNSCWSVYICLNVL